MKRTYGYTTTHDDLVPKEAPKVEEWVDWAYSDPEFTITGLQRHLIAHDIRNPDGRHWQKASLKRLLTNPRIAGRIQGSPGIVDPDKFDAVVAKLTDPARATIPPGRAPRRYLLTGGLIVCGLCGEDMQAKPSTRSKNREPRRNYVCRREPGKNACGRVRIDAEFVEQDVATEVLARLARPHIRRQLAPTTAELQAIPQAIADAENRLAELGRDYADNLIGRTEFLASTAHIHTTIKWMRQLPDAEQVEALLEVTPESLVAWWDAASITQRRNVVALLVEKVQVFPTQFRGYTGYDPNRVKIHPRRKWSTPMPARSRKRDSDETEGTISANTEHHT